MQSLLANFCAAFVYIVLTKSVSLLLVLGRSRSKVDRQLTFSAPELHLVIVAKALGIEEAQQHNLVSKEGGGVREHLKAEIQHQLLSP